MRLATLGAAVVAGASRELPCAPQIADWLYDDPKQSPPGYHVLCVRRGKMDLWAGGHQGEGARVIWESFAAEASLATFRADVEDQLEAHAGVQAQSRWQVLDWGLFRPSGELVSGDDGISGLLLAFEGGRWMWPSIRVGFERVVSVRATNLTLRTVTVNPQAFSVDGFTEDASVDHILGQVAPDAGGLPLLGRSRPPANGASKEPSSTSLALRAKGKRFDERLAALSKRFAGLVRVPLRLLDASVVVTHYEAGQAYAPQHDYFDPVTFRPGEPTPWLNDGRNRLASMFVYLNSVGDGSGGQTNFPLAFSRRVPAGTCVGAQVSPLKGRGLLLYNLNPDGSPNPRSMHGGCEVSAGVKHVGALWAWNQGVSEPKRSGRQAPRRKRRRKHKKAEEL